jgi:hypothetical protein
MDDFPLAPAQLIESHRPNRQQNEDGEQSDLATELGSGVRRHFFGTLWMET